MTQLKPVVIDRSKWQRRIPEKGYPKFPGQTRLYHPLNGGMCCLGFDAVQACGKTLKEIELLGDPSAIGIDDWNLTDAIGVNDRPDLYDIKTSAEQEAKLIEIFRANGRELSFVGEG